MLRLPTSPLYRVMAVCLSVAFLAGASARAGTSTFVGGGGNDWWGTTANWDAGGIPNGTDDIAVFSLSANPSYSTNTHPGPPYTVQELVYNTASTWRMHNNERDINLEGPGGGASTAWVTQNGSGAVTFDCDLRLAGLTTPGGTVTFRGSGTGDMTVNGSILTGPGQRLGIYGTGSLVKEGGYALIVNTVIQHDGSTTVNDGILRLNQSGLPLGGGSNGQFGSAGQTVTVNTGGTLELTRDWVMGGGQQHELVADGGTIAFAGADNYQSKITLTGGHVTTSGGTRPWRTGNFGPGLITVNPSADSSTIDGSLCFVGTAAAPTTTFDVADGAAADDLIMSSYIFDHPGFEGDMVLVKTGAGKMVLTGNSAYTGGTVVSQGTLQLGNGGTTGAIAGTVTLGDANTGAEDVAFLVNRSDGNTHANPIVVSALGTGTATIGSAGTAGGPYGTIFTGPVTLNRPTTMQGTDPDRTTFTNLISGNVGVLTVAGGARTTWEADNTFVGDVDVQGAGTILQVGSGSGATTQQIPNASNVNLGAGARLYLVFDDETINGLTGSGTVSFYPSGGLGATTLTVGAGGANATFAGSIQNGSPTAMNLIKTGPGTQVLSGANTYTGTTTVQDGMLLVNGTHTGGAAYTVTGGTLGGTGVISAPLRVQAGAALAPGDGGVGTLNVGSLTLDPGATLMTQITGAGAADLVNVTGTVDLDQAVLRVLFGYEPAEMDSWLILTNDLADAILPDTFAGLPEGATFYAPGSSRPLQITYQGGTGNDIALTAVPEPATMLAVFGGLAGLGGYLRRRRRA